MKEKQRSNAKAFASITSNDDARYAEEEEEEILPGIRDALSRETAKRRKNIQFSPQMRDKLLEDEESPFPKTKLHPEEDTAKELTMDEYFALRTGLQEVIQSDVKEKMILLREQLSEYHSVLDDVIAYKSRCERLEQEKQDLLSLCREACQARDDKIALLENELARLRSENGTVASSSSDGASSLIGIPAPALTSRTPKMSDHHHHYYNVAARMISLSPSSVPNIRSISEVAVVMTSK